MKKIQLISSLIFANFIYSDCPDIQSYEECIQWPDYCEWNEETEQCQNIGGGTGGGTGGGGTGDGPYEYATITESDGLRNGPDYRDGVVYYPVDGNPPYKSIVFTPGFGGGSSTMSSWAQFFASHGFLSMTVGPNDEINDSHQQRGEGLLDGIESIKQENIRSGSPLYGMIDENSFSVGGYSMGGGASHDAAMMDNSLDAVISLNPTVLFDDCNYCPGESFEGVTYCICLVPELIDHSIPSIMFAGQVEVNELSAYEGMLGQDIYSNMQETTDKIMFEGAGSGHGFAAYPNGEVSDYALNWLKYQVLEDTSACEHLLTIPSSASEYLINITCEESLLGDLNNDLVVNVLDAIEAVNLVLNGEYNVIADMNFDGVVNILDIIEIIYIILN